MLLDDIYDFLRRNRNKKLFSIKTDLKECKILERINRFVVLVSINGNKEFVHINNTGKLNQWLIKNSYGKCYNISGKKLKYRLFYVKNNNGEVIIDTLLHMRSFEVILERIGKRFKRNPKVENVVFDYIVDNNTLVEIKSTTLKNGIFSEYPDTYTERGVNQVETLADLSKKYETLLIFVSGVRNASKFRINKTYGREIMDILENQEIPMISYSIYFKKNSIYIERLLNIEI